MSNLRLFGILAGVIGLCITFLVYRGPKWKKSNFILFSLINLSLILVSINPSIVNFVRDIFFRREGDLRRIISLLIISNIFLLFYFVYSKNKINDFDVKFDKLVRNLGIDDFEEAFDYYNKIKPIMIVIPAYNEAENLKELIPKLPNQIKNLDIGVLVVNDGSDDNTQEVARELGALVISNKINRGQGAASRLGYEVLVNNDALIGVTMDADNQHAPDEVTELIGPIIYGDCDLVIGSRILGKEEKSNRIRRMGVSIFSKIISIAIGQRITDCSSGYKAFNMEKLRDMNLTEDQFQSAEVIIEARKKGLKICEVPANIRKRRYGKSKKGPDINYGVSFAKTIIKTWWRKI